METQNNGKITPKATKKLKLVLAKTPGDFYIRQLTPVAYQRFVQFTKME